MFYECFLGRRLLSKWVLFPLYRLEDIEERQQAVQEMIQSGLIRNSYTIEKYMKKLGDMERQVSCLLQI
jgi:DNA mismatch repair ATPase MutS